MISADFKFEGWRGCLWHAYKHFALDCKCCSYLFDTLRVDLFEFLIAGFVLINKNVNKIITTEFWRNAPSNNRVTPGESLLLDVISEITGVGRFVIIIFVSHPPDSM